MVFNLVTNLWSEVAIVQTGVDVSTAYWVRIGGFFGAILVFIFPGSELFARYLSDAKLVQ